MQKNQPNISSMIRNLMNQDEHIIAEQNRLEGLRVLIHSLSSEFDSLQNYQTRYLNVKLDLPKVVETFEADLIRCALMRTGGNQRRAARLLNIKATTLNNKIKKMGISLNGLSFSSV